MNSSPRFRCADRIGFSLVEMMVALCVVSLLVVMFANVLGLMSSSWVNGRAKVNDFTKARAMLDLMEHDIQYGLFRPDLPAFPPLGINASSLEFYTLRPGISASGSGSTAERDISLVQYGISSGTSGAGVTSTLQRYDFAVNWSDNPSSTVPFGNSSSFTVSPTPRDTAPGVIALKTLFIQSDGTMSTTYASVSSKYPTRCIAFAIAVTSDQTLMRMTSAQLASLQNALNAAATGTHSIKADWEAYLNGSSMDWTHYPKSLGTDLKTFERYVLLPNNP
jgi:type II secretory pathway pseudopilin PulG